MSFLVLFFAMCLAVPSLAQTSACLAPPDERTWDEAFAAISTTNLHHYGDRDAARLKQLDKDRTIELLLSWLPKAQPDYLRNRAVRCLGYNAFSEAIPQIEAIVRNPMETPDLRCLALNIGLRYMRVPKALDIAKDFVKNENPQMRIGAYWVLSDYGNEEAWLVLRRALTTDMELQHELVYALHKSGDPQAGQCVYRAIAPESVLRDVELAWRYALVMKEHRILMAASVLAPLAESSHKMTKRYVTEFFAQHPTAAVEEVTHSQKKK